MPGQPRQDVLIIQHFVLSFGHKNQWNTDDMDMFDLI